MSERNFTDLELERSLAGDLPADRAAALDRDATPADRARLDELRAEHAAFLGGVDVDEQVRRIEQRVARDAPAGKDRKRAWLSWAIPAGTLAMAAAVILMIVVRPGGDDAATTDDDIQAKGDAVALTVHLDTGGAASRALASGDTIAAGDRVRFEVAAPVAGYVAVIGVDGAGKTTVFYPYGGTAAAAFDPRAGRVLPGAIAFDATPGDETIRVHFSRSPFTVDDIPARASTAMIVLRKLPPK